MTLSPVVGESFPDFALETAAGDTLRKSDLAGRKAVLFFFPKAMTPGCTSEAREFSAAQADFETAGATVVGISRDPPARLAAFAARQALTVALASDAAEPALSEALGIWTEKQLYGRRFMGLLRTTYLLEPDGRIAAVWPKVKVKGHVAQVLGSVQSA